MLLSQAMHQVDLGSHPPFATSGSTLDLLNDIFGRTIQISGLYHFAAALRMNQNLDAWVFGTCFLNLLHVKAHMRGAIPFPENNSGALDLLFSIFRRHRIFGIPDSHLIFANPIFKTSIATKVLIREEQHTFPLLK